MVRNTKHNRSRSQYKRWTHRGGYEFENAAQYSANPLPSVTSTAVDDTQQKKKLTEHLKSAAGTALTHISNLVSSLIGNKEDKETLIESSSQPQTGGKRKRKTQRSKTQRSKTQRSKNGRMHTRYAKKSVRKLRKTRK